MPDQPSSPNRGTPHLLWDCENLGNLLGRERRPARVRIEAELGPELTEVLLVSLASLRQDAAADDESDAA